MAEMMEARGLDTAKSAALRLVRRGQPQILWTPPRIGLGNFFYLWLQAFRRQQQGQSCRVLATTDMQKWRGVFSAVSDDLLIDRRAVRFRDDRVLGFFQRWGVDYQDGDLRDFNRHYLLSSAGLLDEVERAGVTVDTVVVNVRRGDYYSVPRFRGLYSFDIVSYLREALDAARRQGPIERIHVVSDGLDWCQLKLPFLRDYAPVTWASPQPRPLEHLGTLVAARRLVLGNSSFSYWGAYLSNNFHENADPALVWAPRFHRRDPEGSASYHLDPRWSVIEDIPGGWDA